MRNHGKRRANPFIAQADADIVITTSSCCGTENIPSPRKGYVWAPGYWKWEENQHVWVEGHWIEERHDAHWVPDKWWQDPNDVNHWHFRPGHWDEG